ncbi:cupin domain-containing protein [Streptomyces sp. NBC_00726]|uniref:cupin domain-containing protein n=1 Tax=Streptomyces sp. NBC_00726 TaxID=2903674 RepID=UPI00386A3320
MTTENVTTEAVTTENVTAETVTTERIWATEAGRLPVQERPFGTIGHFPASQERMRVSYVGVQPGRPAPVTRHALSGELVYVVSGSAAAYIDGTVETVGAGATLYLPPGTSHGFKAYGEPATLLVVHVPSVPPAEDHEAVLPDFDA